MINITISRGIFSNLCSLVRSIFYYWRNSYLVYTFL